MRRRPDILHVGLIGYESMFLFVIARVARIPCVVTFHGTYSLANFGSARRIPVPVLALEDVALRSSWNAVVCVDYHSEQFLRRRFGIPEQRLWVIPSGVDAAEFRAESARSSTDSEPKYTILCPRRVDPKNGIEYIIRASIKCKLKIPGLRLLIAGRTNQGLQEYERFLQGIIRSSNSESYISFLGDVEHAKMPHLYNSVDLVVIPSLAEARSLSALEAMACEKPVIASNVGGLPEIITDGLNGILVRPADVDDLASAICRLHEEPELSRTLGQNARLVALRNDWKVRTEKYERLYDYCENRRYYRG